MDIEMVVLSGGSPLNGSDANTEETSYGVNGEAQDKKIVRDSDSLPGSSEAVEGISSSGVVCDGIDQGENVDGQVLEGLEMSEMNGGGGGRIDAVSPGHRNGGGGHMDDVSLGYLNGGDGGYGNGSSYINGVGEELMNSGGHVEDVGHGHMNGSRHMVGVSHGHMNGGGGHGDRGRCVNEVGDEHIDDGGHMDDVDHGNMNGGHMDDVDHGNMNGGDGGHMDDVDHGGGGLMNGGEHDNYNSVGSNEVGVNGGYVNVETNGAQIGNIMCTGHDGAVHSQLCTPKCVQADNDPSTCVVSEEILGHSSDCRVHGSDSSNNFCNDAECNAISECCSPRLTGRLNHREGHSMLEDCNEVSDSDNNRRFVNSNRDSHSENEANHGLSDIAPFQLRSFPDIPIDVVEYCFYVEIDCGGVDLEKLRQVDWRDCKGVTIETEGHAVGSNGCDSQKVLENQSEKNTEEICDEECEENEAEAETSFGDVVKEIESLLNRSRDLCEDSVGGTTIVTDRNENKIGEGFCVSEESVSGDKCRDVKIVKGQKKRKVKDVDLMKRNRVAKKTKRTGGESDVSSEADLSTQCNEGEPVSGHIEEKVKVLVRKIEAARKTLRAGAKRDSSSDADLSVKVKKKTLSDFDDKKKCAVSSECDFLKVFVEPVDCDCPGACNCAVYYAYYNISPKKQRPSFDIEMFDISEVLETTDNKLCASIVKKFETFGAIACPTDKSTPLTIQDGEDDTIFHIDMELNSPSDIKCASFETSDSCPPAPSDVISHTSSVIKAVPSCLSSNPSSETRRESILPRDVSSDPYSDIKTDSILPSHLNSHPFPDVNNSCIVASDLIDSHPSSNTESDGMILCDLNSHPSTFTKYDSCSSLDTARADISPDALISDTENDYGYPSQPNSPSASDLLPLPDIKLTPIHNATRTTTTIYPQSDNVLNGMATHSVVHGKGSLNTEATSFQSESISLEVKTTPLVHQSLVHQSCDALVSKSMSYSEDTLQTNSPPVVYQNSDTKPDTKPTHSQPQDIEYRHRKHTSSLSLNLDLFDAMPHPDKPPNESTNHSIVSAPNVPNIPRPAPQRKTVFSSSAVPMLQRASTPSVPIRPLYASTPPMSIMGASTRQRRIYRGPRSQASQCETDLLMNSYKQESFISSFMESNLTNQGNFKRVVEVFESVVLLESKIKEEEEEEERCREGRGDNVRSILELIDEAVRCAADDDEEVDTDGCKSNGDVVGCVDDISNGVIYVDSKDYDDNSEQKEDEMCRGGKENERSILDIIGEAMKRADDEKDERDTDGVDYIDNNDNYSEEKEEEMCRGGKENERSILDIIGEAMRRADDEKVESYTDSCKSNPEGREENNVGQREEATVAGDEVIGVGRCVDDEDKKNDNVECYSAPSSLFTEGDWEWESSISSDDSIPFDIDDLHSEDAATSAAPVFSYVRKSEICPDGWSNPFYEAMFIAYWMAGRPALGASRRKITISHCCGSSDFCWGQFRRRFPERYRLMGGQPPSDRQPMLTSFDDDVGCSSGGAGVSRDELYQDAVKEGRKRRERQSSYFDAEGRRKDSEGRSISTSSGGASSVGHSESSENVSSSVEIGSSVDSKIETSDKEKCGDEEQDNDDRGESDEHSGVVGNSSEENVSSYMDAGDHVESSNEGKHNVKSNGHERVNGESDEMNTDVKNNDYPEKKSNGKDDSDDKLSDVAEIADKEKDVAKDICDNHKSGSRDNGEEEKSDVKVKDNCNDDEMINGDDDDEDNERESVDGVVNEFHLI